MPLILPPLTQEKEKRLVSGDPLYEHLLVRRFRYWSLYLNQDQRYLYRSYLWRSDGHIDLQARHTLKGWQKKELEQLVALFHKALQFRSKPDLINEGWYGNEVQVHRGHAHLHLIPRYHDPPELLGRAFPDPNFGKHYNPHEKLILDRQESDTIRDKLEIAIDWALSA